MFAYECNTAHIPHINTIRLTYISVHVNTHTNTHTDTPTDLNSSTRSINWYNPSSNSIVVRVLYHIFVDALCSLVLVFAVPRPTVGILISMTLSRFCVVVVVWFGGCNRRQYIERRRVVASVVVSFKGFRSGVFRTSLAGFTTPTICLHRIFQIVNCVWSQKCWVCGKYKKVQKKT